MSNDIKKPGRGIRICHLSDIHLPLCKKVPLLKMLNKRVLGYLNLKFNRSKTHNLQTIKGLLSHMSCEDYDLAVVTGDLANLSLTFEFKNILDVFADAGMLPEKTLIVPGNHDRYTKGADKKRNFEKTMSKWICTGQENIEYPVLRVFDEVVVAGLDTAVWRGPLRSAGLVRKEQVDKLVAIINEKSNQGKRLVIVMHHPPFKLVSTIFKNYLSGLENTGYLLRQIKNFDCTLLHGHLHMSIQRKTGNMEIIGVSSASNNTGRKITQSSYNVLNFSLNGLETAQSVSYWPDATRKEDLFKRETFYRRPG